MAAIKIMIHYCGTVVNSASRTNEFQINSKRKPTKRVEEWKKKNQLQAIATLKKFEKSKQDRSLTAQTADDDIQMKNNELKMK